MKILSMWRSLKEILQELENNEIISLNRLSEIRLEVKQITDYGFYNEGNRLTAIIIFLNFHGKITKFMLDWDNKKDQVTDQELD